MFVGRAWCRVDNFGVPCPSKLCVLCNGKTKGKKRRPGLGACDVVQVVAWLRRTHSPRLRGIL